jgi:hypothetical protein
MQQPSADFQQMRALMFSDCPQTRLRCAAISRPFKREAKLGVVWFENEEPTPGSSRLPLADGAWKVSSF